MVGYCSKRSYRSGECEGGKIWGRMSRREKGGVGGYVGEEQMCKM